MKNYEDVSLKHHAYFPVKGQKISNPGQTQDRFESTTRPWNKGLSWKIQDGCSPYIWQYYYFRQVEYVLPDVCLSVCLFVCLSISRITQKVDEIF